MSRAFTVDDLTRSQMRDMLIRVLEARDRISNGWVDKDVSQAVVDALDEALRIDGLQYTPHKQIFYPGVVYDALTGTEIRKGRL